MNKKYIVLLMAFLGVSLGVQAQSCQLSYKSVVTDPNIGSATRSFELDGENPTLIEDVWALKDIDFDGDCDCTLTVYSKNTLTGCSATRAFTSTSSKHIDVVGGLWKRSTSPASFTVTCQFDFDEEEEDSVPLEFRALTPEEAADPIAEYIFSNAPPFGLQSANTFEPNSPFTLTGSNIMVMAIGHEIPNRIYLVTSGVIGNNGERGMLQTTMGTGMNGDYTTINGVYLSGWNVVYPN